MFVMNNESQSAHESDQNRISTSPLLPKHPDVDQTQTLESSAAEVAAAHKSSSTHDNFEEEAISESKLEHEKLLAAGSQDLQHANNGSSSSKKKKKKKKKSQKSLLGSPQQRPLSATPSTTPAAVSRGDGNYSSSSTSAPNQPAITHPHGSSPTNVGAASSGSSSATRPRASKWGDRLRRTWLYNALKPTRVRLIVVFTLMLFGTVLAAGSLFAPWSDLYDVHYHYRPIFHQSASFFYVLCILTPVFAPLTVLFLWWKPLPQYRRPIILIFCMFLVYGSFSLAFLITFQFVDLGILGIRHVPKDPDARPRSVAKTVVQMSGFILCVAAHCVMLLGFVLSLTLVKPLVQSWEYQHIDERYKVNVLDYGNKISLRGVRSTQRSSEV